MSFGTALGFPQQSGVSIARLYASQLLIQFYIASTFAAITTTEFEDQLQSSGDVVRIRTLPDIEVYEYIKGQKLKVQNPNPGYVDVPVDLGAYWNFALNALDMKQYDYDAGERWATHASTNLGVHVDSKVLKTIYLDAHASNTGATAGLESGDIDLGSSGSPVSITRANILEFIIEDCGVVLDEQNVPRTDRFMVLPSWACARLKLSDLKDASITGDGESTIRNGRIGMVDDFEVFKSNNLALNTTDSAHSAIFGHKGCTAFATQMKEDETVDNQDDFGKLRRQLMAYGKKVIKPEGIGHGYIAKG